VINLRFYTLFCVWLLSHIFGAKITFRNNEKMDLKYGAMIDLKH